MFYFTRRIRPSYPRYSYVTETPLFQQVSNQIREFLQHTLRNFILVKFIRYVERGKTRYSLLLAQIKKKKKNVIYRWKSKQETKDRLNKISWWSVGQIDWNVACKNRSSMMQLKYSNNIFFHIILLFYYTI